MPKQRPARRTSTVVIRASVEGDGRFVARITIISDWTPTHTPHAVSSQDDLVHEVRTWLAGIDAAGVDRAP